MRRTLFVGFCLVSSLAFVHSQKQPYRVVFDLTRAIALKNNDVDKSQLLPGVQTVPDGIHELVMEQQENRGYIKVVH